MTELNRIFKVGEDGLSESDTIPLYRQIINSVADAIFSKRLNSDDRLPPEPELMKLFNVSRVTLRAAMQVLVDDGLLTRIQGKGTFVNKGPYKMYYNKFFGFADSCETQGMNGRAVILSKEYVPPKDCHREFFKDNPRPDILMVKRLLYIEERPAVVEYTYYSGNLFSHEPDPSFFLDPSTLRALSAEKLIHNIGGRFEMSAGSPNADEQNLLDIPANFPLLITTDWYYKLPGNVPLFITEQKTNTQLLSYYWDRVIDFT